MYMTINQHSFPNSRKLGRVTIPDDGDNTSNCTVPELLRLARQAIDAGRLGEAQDWRNVADSENVDGTYTRRIKAAWADWTDARRAL